MAARRGARNRGARPVGPSGRRARPPSAIGLSASRSRRRRTSISRRASPTRHLPFRPTGAIWRSRHRRRRRRGLWLHSFDSLVSRPIPGTEGAFGPFWSPDGLAVGFFTQNRLKRVSISGGDVATICEARFGGGATWNRDGVILFAPGIDTALFRVSAAGGTPTPVTVLDPAHGESAHPDRCSCRTAATSCSRLSDGDTAGHYVASLESPERKRLPLEGVGAWLQLAGLPLFRARPHPDGPAARPEASRADR